MRTENVDRKEYAIFAIHKHLGHVLGVIPISVLQLRPQMNRRDLVGLNVARFLSHPSMDPPPPKLLLHGIVAGYTNILTHLKVQ
jgi:hypothetical protein